MKVLCTQPRDPALVGLPPPGAADYLTTLERHLATAKQLVQVVCPFIDAVGVDVLEAAYRRAEGNARWEVYTRSPLARLREAAARNGWKLYAYKGTPGEDPHRGFHCKLFVFDERVAIVGSANLIYANLVENVEIGLLVDAPEALTALLAVPRALRRASRLEG